MSARYPDPASLIGTGMTAAVYAWGAGRALKLYHRDMADSIVDREYANTRAVKAIGLPVPQAYEIIETGGRRGIVFDRVEGPTLFEHVQARPWTLFAAARQLAELHARLHGCAAPRELPDQIRRIDQRIGAAPAASDEEKQIARRRLADLPAGESLCHGDFHPGNVFLTSAGPVIIDWSAATRGHPLGDVARTSHLLQTVNLPLSAPLHIRMLFKTSRALLHRTYVNWYLQLRQGTRRQIEEWQPPLRIAATAWRADAPS